MRSVCLWSLSLALFLAIFGCFSTHPQDLFALGTISLSLSCFYFSNEAPKQLLGSGCAFNPRVEFRFEFKVMFQLVVTLGRQTWNSIHYSFLLPPNTLYTSRLYWAKDDCVWGNWRRFCVAVLSFSSNEQPHRPRRREKTQRREKARREKKTGGPHGWVVIFAGNDVKG